MGREQKPEPPDLRRLLGRNLVELRGRVGLSQQATADRAGLHRTHVALIEAGKRFPRLDTIVKLAGAVEVEPCALLMGMAWKLDPQKEGSK
jgi:transcriptional regulator with XRE-family HTH domain